MYREPLFGAAQQAFGTVVSLFGALFESPELLELGSGERRDGRLRRQAARAIGQARPAQGIYRVEEVHP